MYTTENAMYSVVLSEDKEQYARSHWNSIMLWPTKQMAYNWSRNKSSMYQFRVIVRDANGKVIRARFPKPDELEVVEVTCSWE